MSNKNCYGADELTDEEGYDVNFVSKGNAIRIEFGDEGQFSITVQSEYEDLDKIKKYIFEILSKFKIINNNSSKNDDISSKNKNLYS